MLLLLIGFTLFVPSCKEEDNTVAADSVSLSAQFLSLTVGQTHTLVASVLPVDAKLTIAWSTSNAAVVTVDNNGVFTALFVGTSVITSTADGKSSNCEVSVTASNNTGGTGALVFTDNSAFDITTLVKSNAIKSVDVSTGASGGTKPYSYTATGLPAGVSISAATGVISGTPTALGNAGTATITVKDAASQNSMGTVATLTR